MRRKVRRLSGGQQTQVALTLTLAKRPDLLILDEPVAGLDPLARREFTRSLLTAAAEDGLTVIVSSHVVAELERFCDWLVLLHHGRIQVAGDVDTLLSQHRRISVDAERHELLQANPGVVNLTRGPRRATALIRIDPTHPLPADGTAQVGEPTLEDLVLGY